MKRKVIRGGSLKDVAYFLQLGARDYEYQDTAKVTSDSEQYKALVET